MNQERARAEGYGKLHEDLLTKIRLLADKNHALETELQRSRHDNQHLQGLLSDAERRTHTMKHNIENYSQELSVLYFEFRI